MPSETGRPPNSASLAERLERGELVFFPVTPFRLPSEDDGQFLRAQRGVVASRQPISFDPTAGNLTGQRSTDDAERLARLMRSFSDVATGWLANELPEYQGKWSRDRATLRPEEEAIRSLGLSARNDLLHIDHFPDRPAAGRRLLRLFVNINTEDERVWITSEIFDSLLARYQSMHRLISRSESEWREPLKGMQRLLQRDWSGRPAYDSFMQDLQHFLRSDDQFQDKAAKRFWHFPPNSCWLLFADGLSHAVLRGQYAMEHSFFVPKSALVLPELSPLRQIVNAGQATRLRQAG